MHVTLRSCVSHNARVPAASEELHAMQLAGQRSFSTREDMDRFSSRDRFYLSEFRNSHRRVDEQAQPIPMAGTRHIDEIRRSGHAVVTWLVAGAIDGGPNEVGLRGRVRLAVVLEFVCQSTLQCGVLLGDIAVAAKVVTKRQLIAKSR